MTRGTLWGREKIRFKKNFDLGKPTIQKTTTAKEETSCIFCENLIIKEEVSIKTWRGKLCYKCSVQLCENKKNYIRDLFHKNLDILKQLKAWGESERGSKLLILKNLEERKVRRW